MDHDVLNFGEFILDSVMHPLGNSMSFVQAFLSICQNLYIDINFIAKHSRMKRIYAQNTVLAQNIFAHLVFKLDIASTVNHTVNRFAEDIERYFDDKDANHNAG